MEGLAQRRPEATLGAHLRVGTQRLRVLASTIDRYMMVTRLHCWIG